MKRSVYKFYIYVFETDKIYNKKTYIFIKELAEFPLLIQFFADCPERVDRALRFVLDGQLTLSFAIPVTRSVISIHLFFYLSIYQLSVSVVVCVYD